MSDGDQIAIEIGEKVAAAAKSLWDNFNPRPTPQTHRWKERRAIFPGNGTSTQNIDLVDLRTQQTIARIHVEVSAQRVSVSSHVVRSPIVVARS